ncbi:MULTISPECIES: O-antigen polymerase [unclassified Shewanella]|uniref:O-antigen polymerase n=1 Tax=unclassified Shewanella TaxID=196818 RepID=UPI0039B57801
MELLSKISIAINLQKLYWSLFFGVCLTISSIALFANENEYTYSYVLIFWLVFSISIFLYSRKNLFLFEPMVLFSFFYYFIAIACLHMIKTDFVTNIYVQETSFNRPIIELFEKTLMLYLGSYLFVVIGYLIVNRRGQYQPIIFPYKSEVSHRLIYIVVFLFYSSGLINFIYNVYTLSGGNVVNYMASISVRSYQYADSGGTALFYNLMYIACYLWFYCVVSKKTSYFEKICFVFFVMLSVFIMSSQGRIFLTLAYCLSFVGIKYGLHYLKFNHVSNLKFFGFGFFVLFLGLLFYVLRAISSLNENAMLDASVFFYVSEFFTVDMLGYYAVDKGNIPNPGVVMKIIDSWENDVGYLYGESIVTWVFNVFPSFIRPEHSVPSVIIKDTWYQHIQGGNLPPTGPGEMLSNFGYYGAFLGMAYFGALCAFMNNLLRKYNNFWFLCIYMLLSLQFFALYPKVEFENLRLFLPILLMLTVLLIRKSTKILRRI